MLVEWLERVCRGFLESDPNIVEIIQFGSSVYSPEYARDVDILIFSREPRDYEVYLDAVERVAPPFNIDVVVARPGDRLRENLARSVLGAFNVLYGSGEHVLEYAKMLGDPSFDEAEATLRVARRVFGIAKEVAEPLERDRLVREAFDMLFHAARIAAMTYLSREVSRWGALRRMLPEPYSGRFKEFIEVLHIKYFYNGEYPREDFEKEFNEWHHKVEKFVENLKLEIKRKE